jgi:hypothetical protein
MVATVRESFVETIEPVCGCFFVRRNVVPASWSLPSKLCEALVFSRTWGCGLREHVRTLTYCGYSCFLRLYLLQ